MLHDAADTLDALRAFAARMMEDWPDECDFDLQDAAVEYGLLALADPAPTEPCGERCSCAEYFGEEDWAAGVQCYRRTAILTGDAP